MMCITEYNEAETYELYGARCEAIGEARGEARGRATERIKTLVELNRSGLISEDNAAKNANMAIEDFRKAVASYSLQ